MSLSGKLRRSWTVAGLATGFSSELGGWGTTLAMTALSMQMMWRHWTWYTIIFCYIPGQLVACHRFHIYYRNILSFFHIFIYFIHVPTSHTLVVDPYCTMFHSLIHLQQFIHSFDHSFISLQEPFHSIDHSIDHSIPFMTVHDRFIV